ncbi:MAG: ATP-dependent helicase [Candidatus Aminicenantes bacterium]|nr:MAG: ATP-dependent helicase [Candidatus Aminicenantes bacterium]
MKKYKIKKSAAGPKEHYIIDYKAELNPQQYKAAANIEGAQLVIAGAGTGKTRTLIYRLAYMVENGISPQSILLLTFTRKAAQEMMRRAATILDERCSKVSGGTYHSFANYILRKYALYIRMHPNFTILDRTDCEDVINLIRTQLGFNKKERRFPRKRTLMEVISKAVNKCTTVEKVVLNEYPHYNRECDDILTVADHYRKFKQEKQAMDYDDLLVNLKKLLETSDEVRQKISNTYRYIMVDEYQDTNKLQGEITVLLASEHKNVLVVGDDSQSIYSFRGANFRNIMDFPKLFPGTVITTLEQNYRSTRPILDLTNAVIQQAKEKYSKELFSKIEGVQKPVYIDAVDEGEQAAFVTQQVLELREEGVPLHKIAVLFRASWHANELEIALRNANIPYVKYGGLKFTEAAHIKDVLAYMRVIHNVFDEIAWLRLLLLIEGIGSASASKIITKIFQQGGALEQLLSKDFAKKKYFNDLGKLHALLSRLSGSRLKPAEKLEAVIEYYSPLFELKYDDFGRRREDLRSLLRIAERYARLEQLLTDLTLEPPDLSQMGVEPTGSEDEKLVLSTIHSAKGLEWHSVFIIHLVEGYFPGMQSMESDEDLEEERRLFYVAATRAQKNLYLITPELESRSWGAFYPSGIVFSEPSRFITGIPDFDELIEIGVLEFEEQGPF